MIYLLLQFLFLLSYFFSKLEQLVSTSEARYTGIGSCQLHMHSFWEQLLKYGGTILRFHIPVQMC